MATVVLTIDYETMLKVLRSGLYQNALKPYAWDVIDFWMDEIDEIVALIEGEP
ncbi:hypothetical protein LCGC14_1858770 [marine sediment metagenome]|uniref:Uncharacterized protein n=1 Tax=marine sediment metagenome TaxID=412755 RepID=A0A0F9G8D7_9ZZZZ